MLDARLCQHAAIERDGILIDVALTNSTVILF